ncbi:hypothetical protein HMPREF9946_00859 [Acetobacteraceae bacterium AT-5844]|nr:hypothetical protein HMPREF9946_00859 [Acetobacteraceae bacterium AT-5844]
MLCCSYRYEHSEAFSGRRWPACSGGGTRAGTIVFFTFAGW